MNSLALPIFGSVLIGAVASAAEPSIASADEYIRPFSIVAIPVGANEAHKDAAKEIAAAIGVKFVNEMKSNPACCIWIEITGWTPNPGEPGYIIVNQSGGSIVTASNEQQLRAAVERFKKSIRKTNGVVEVPLGLLTSYPIAAVGRTDK